METVFQRPEQHAMTLTYRALLFILWLNRAVILLKLGCLNNWAEAVSKG